MMPQYKKCPSDEILLQIALEQLKPDESVQSHINQCTDCLETLRTIKSMHYQLESTARPMPSRDSKKTYRTELAGRLKEKQSKAQSKFFFRPAYVFGVAAVFIFSLGLWLGKTWNSPQLQPELTDSIISEMQFMNHYMEQSEIWLLTVMNQSQGSQPNWETNDKLLTQQLLQQTYQLERDSDFFNHPFLIPFIEQIETLLLEVANADSNQIGAAFSLIRNTVEERQLLLQNQNIQKELAETAPMDVTRL